MSRPFSKLQVIQEIKRSLRLAMPLIASETIYALNGFFATMMIAHVGKSQLAANALVWSVHTAIIVFFIGIYNAVGIMGAQSFGAQDRQGLTTCFQQGLILASLLSIPAMGLLWVAPVILKLTGQQPEIIQLAVPLFHALSWSMLPFSGLFVMEQFLVAIGKPKAVMWMSIIQVPIQIFLYYALLFGKFGLPKLGLAGVGYGFGLSFLILLIVFTLYLYRSACYQPYRLFQKWWRINKTFLFEMLRVGLPLAFLYCLEVAFFAVVAFMMGRLSINVLAAYQIAYQFFMIGLTLIFAMVQVVGIRVGHEVGRNNKEALKLTYYTNMGLTFFAMLLFLIAFITIPNQMIGIDIDLHSKGVLPIVNMAKLFLALSGILLLSDSIRIISLGVLRSMKDTRFPVFASIIGFWLIAFPLAYALGFKWHFGGKGIWWGMILGLAITGCLLVIRFHRIIKSIQLSELVTK